MSSPERSRRFLLLLFAAAAGLLALVVAPLLGALFAGAVFAVVMQPLHDWLAPRLGGRPRAAAALLTAGLGLVVLLPLGWLSVTVVRQVVDGVGRVVEVVEERGIDGVLEVVPEPLHPYVERLERMMPVGVLPARGADPAGGAAAAVADPAQAGSDVAAVGSLLARVAGAAQAMLGGLVGFLVQLGMLAVALYFLLAEGRGLVGWVVDTAPLPAPQMREFAAEFRDVMVGVFVSTVITAALQAAIAAIGYLVVGVDHFAALLLLTFALAFVPAIGGAVVVVAVGVFYVLAGDLGWGAFLVGWGCVPVGLCDNLAKPMLAGRRLRLPSSVLFFAMLGGLAAFGVMGVVAGPLIVSFFLVVTRALGADHRGAAPAAS